MTWLGEAAPVERARELLEHVTEQETATWSEVAWTLYRDNAPGHVTEAARDVARHLDAARRALRRFVAEDERIARRREREDLVRLPSDDDGCGLYPPEDARDDDG